MKYSCNLMTMLVVAAHGDYLTLIVMPPDTHEYESYRTIECLFRLVQAIKAQ